MHRTRQETDRHNDTAAVDERTRFELYYPVRFCALPHPDLFAPSRYAVDHEIVSFTSGILSFIFIICSFLILLSLSQIIICNKRTTDTAVRGRCGGRRRLFYVQL